ncbi:TOX high mobility group box family member 2 isoform X1 [Carcharodon carcharias]|uniref:TOX high mobility group box family member 2 isoform X1 n=2 Tax=Carcharodon carcharias TaxID=13397 RepID=UPI001B7EBA8C|nr:TOX high mobility group box family member 2 isoform X1 [Carcharodon carcharias]XP_041059659.1 TOX high mobility group box family member 2 isoform X1 [Carcharodon carcharias]
MDVRFYPTAPATVGALPADPTCLGSASCLEHYYCNKFDGDNMYMSLTDANQDYLPANQSFAGQGLGDEDYEIPPITPPNLGDPSFLHLMDPHAGYHSLCHSVPPNGLLPQYAYQGMDLPAIMVSNMLGQDGHPLSSQLPMMHGMGHPEGPQYDSGPQHPLVSRSGIMPPSHMPAISHSQLNAQVSLNVGRSILTHGSPSPPGSKSATPSPSSSAHEEEADHLSKIGGEKRPSVDMGKKTKTQKKKKKKDPNEPQKPVSAYALFFRDTQAAIKGQNPNATFGDVSKIVASMWDGLGEEQKQAYKRKTEAAKKEYLKALAAYRASLVSKSYSDQVETKNGQTSQQSHMIPPKQPLYTLPPQTSSPYIGPNSFLPQSELQTYSGPSHRNLSRTLTSKTVMPQMPLSGSPPPSLQISPPLHQQLSLQHHHHQQTAALNQSISMQQVQSQPIISHQMPLPVQPQLHSPPGQQGYAHIQSEFQNTVSAQSPGSGASNPSVQSSEWDNEYCNNECVINHCSMLPRDKPLYLT